MWHGFDEDIVAADAARVARLAESVPGGAHLIGHSYGGAIALRVALFHPRAVASVAVYEPSRSGCCSIITVRGGPPPKSSDSRGRCVLNCVPRTRLVPPAVSSITRVAPARGGDCQSISRPASRSASLQSPRIVALANDAPRLADYRSLRAPVLVLAESEMRAPVRRIGELLRSTLPNATFETMNEMGHMGPITHPHAVAHRFARFIWEHTLVDDAPERELAA